MSKSKLAKGFISKVVKGYMVSDLRRMTSLEVIPNADGNCNFPIALFTLSCMDFLGYLISLKTLNANGDTTKRIKTYYRSDF